MSPRTEAPPAEATRALRDYFGSVARAVDTGATDVRPGIRKLGAEGLLALGATGAEDHAKDDRFARMVGIVAEVAAECLSSAFAVWSQRMVVEYLSRAAHRQSADPRSIADLRAALAEGTEFGSTAMASALRDLAGIEPVPVTARPVVGGLRLTGTIRWASNLFPGAVVVLPARLADGGRVVTWLRTSDPGVRVVPAATLLALNGTASGSIALDDAECPDAQVLSTDLPGFVHAIRPSFLLLQAAFCSGLAQRSITEASGKLAGVNECFAGEFASAEAENHSVTERLLGLSARCDPARVRELLQLRLDAMRLALVATRLEATVHGGRGYAADSSTARRLREAAFLPIQAPTEGQLRWELSRYA